MKLTTEDLAGIKLVDEEYFASTEEVQAELERAYQQGSQGWGVRREVGVYLTLARDLKLAYHLAEKATQGSNKLKGLQLENGRLKKKIEKLEAEALATDLRIKQLSTELEAAQNAEGLDEDG